jgi:hypothetical protein
MSTPLAPDPERCARRRVRAAWTQAWVLSVALALPMAASPASLSQLLALPLVQLLQLRITAPASAQPAHHKPASSAPTGRRSTS